MSYNLVEHIYVIEKRRKTNVLVALRDNGSVWLGAVQGFPENVLKKQSFDGVLLSFDDAITDEKYQVEAFDELFTMAQIELAH